MAETIQTPENKTEKQELNGRDRFLLQSFTHKGQRQPAHPPSGDTLQGKGDFPPQKCLACSTCKSQLKIGALGIISSEVASWSNSAFASGEAQGDSRAEESLRVEIRLKFG